MREWGLGEEGRREKADHSGREDVRANPRSKQVKPKFVQSEVLLRKALWW